MPTPQTPTSETDRFWAKVTKTDTCWLWNAGTDQGGYGSFGADGRTARAHRYAYELLVGPVPAGLFLDHLCHNDDPTCAGGKACLHRRCVNPAHLEPVTASESARRGSTTAAVNAAKTHCAQGHEFTPENTFEIKPSRTQRNGARGCRTCRRAAHARETEKRRAAAQAKAA